MNLDRLDIGQKGRIVEVKGQGALRKRLLDLGLTPKTQVLVRKKAPLGDPIEIHLRGFELTLRKDEAKHVVVERDENDN
ncbi:MAG: ferrous iron transport protein A [Anaerovoracaceae bacterium]